MHEVRKSWHNLFAFFAVSAFAGLLLDGIAKYLGKLWIYPDWSLALYLILFIPGWAFYWLVITETYLGVKTLVDYLRKGRRWASKPFSFERSFYWVLSSVGLVFSAYAVGDAATTYLSQSLPLATLSDVHSVTETFQISFTQVAMFCIGLFFIFEGIEYYRKKTSFIKDTLHQYYTPLISIFLAALVTAVLMESQNIPVGLWVYTRWPLPEYAIYGIPLLASIAWPLHYLAFLSAFRALTDKESSCIWRGDTVR
jgi:hypothetical protein